MTFQMNNQETLKMTLVFIGLLMAFFGPGAEATDAEPESENGGSTLMPMFSPMLMISMILAKLLK